jgi:ribosomal protein S18
MLPSVGAAATAASASGSASYGAAMSQFVVCRQPWNEYLQQLTREDAEPYKAEMNSKPMYRGRKKGMGGWLMGEQAQLHYRRYPDEHIFSNLQRWRHGEMVNDLALQQFKAAQPHVLELPDEQGFTTPMPEVYMKLNYKNPATFSRFLTRTGHLYPQDILPLNPEAVMLLRDSVRMAKRMGLYPKTGNPYWFRSQQDRPKPYRGEYDPVKGSVKQTMEQYCFNWLQTNRIKTYFRGKSGQQSRVRAAQGATEAKMQAGYDALKKTAQNVPHNHFDDAKVGHSEKVSTVAGLMSTSGMRKNRHLYNKSSKKRMGFPSPLGTLKRI